MRAARPWCAVVAFGTVAFLGDAASAADIQTAPPSTFEYGAHPRSDGWVDFGLRAPAADTAELLIYDAPDAKEPAAAVPMTRDAVGDWGIRVRGPGVGVGTFYMYRVTGRRR